MIQLKFKEKKDVLDKISELIDDEKAFEYMVTFDCVHHLRYEE